MATENCHCCCLWPWKHFHCTKNPNVLGLMFLTKSRVLYCRFQVARCLLTKAADALLIFLRAVAAMTDFVLRYTVICVEATRVE